MKTNKHPIRKFLYKKEKAYLPTHCLNLGWVWANQNNFNCGLTEKKFMFNIGIISLAFILT